MSRTLSIDPAWFDPASVAEDTKALLQRLAEQAASEPGMAELGALEARARRERSLPTLSPRGEDGIIPGPDGNGLQIRIIAPETPRGAYLYFHGGGLILGSARGQDERLIEIADGTGLAVVSVNYRLAPENPWPAAWDDGEAAALWLAKIVTSRFGGDFLAIGGDSAGATLVPPVLVRMRDKHDFTGFKGAAMTCGAFDASGTPSIARNGGPGMVIGEDDVAYCTRCYAPDPASRKLPDLSAIYADLRAMPPALFVSGSKDVFVDDALFLAARWVAEGNEAELAIWPGAPHAFVNYPFAAAREAKARIVAFLKGKADAG